MRLQVLVYQCEPLGHRFCTPDLPFNSYGEFLLRDEAGRSLAYVNAFLDPTFVEVANLLMRIPETSCLPGSRRTDVLHRLYGAVACDPDVDGHPLRIGQHPCCPICSSTVMRCWDEVVPVEFVELDVASVTHVGWQVLPEAEKVEAVRRWLLANGG